MSPFSLEGKIALVTGAGSGIGASIAAVFAKAGATVYVADINEAAGASVTQEIIKSGHKAISILCNVADESSVKVAYEKVLATSGRLDVLVNNAGIGFVGNLLQTAGADMDRMYSVNVRGVFNMSKAFLPGMLARKYGVIINLASIGGMVGVRDRVAYCATKFAVVGITKSMALDHATEGVRINCICPGRVETPFVSARLKEYPDPEKAYREMSASQPIGRMAWPDEIAHAALYLASDEAAFLTGTAFVIDGGFSAGR